METSGRERRHRYYTVANYYKLISEEALDKSSACFTDIDLVDIGKFYAIRSDSFYQNDEELVHHQDAAKDSEPVRGLEPKKSSEGRPLVPFKHSRARIPTSLQDKKLDGNQCRSSVKRKRKTSPSGDHLETAGSEEPLTKRRRLNGTGLNTASMLFLFFIYWQRLILAVQGNEAGQVKPKKMVLISRMWYQGKRGVVRACELRLKTCPRHPQYHKVTLIATLMTVHPLLEP
jgi:hypothetical protein